MLGSSERRQDFLPGLTATYRTLLQHCTRVESLVCRI
ncbi:hypothetical protein GDO81_011389 [Engystomops pustulosus]|uniref:Uncharacterized protein n=1 Tax=Engystomops pustulosus TaxID=76066 RepID=A0AAV7BDQ9_ENGPU|nr:hypothetical protein GDO81_011389 [Engystomops pustulosus]